MKNSWLISFVLSIALFSQTDFEKHGSEPVLEKGNYPSWDFVLAADCWVIKEKDTFKMWYTGGGISPSSDTNICSRIGYAWSTDGINWSKTPKNPVLNRDTNSWDSLGVETVTVIIDSTADNEEKYKMWYAGHFDSLYNGLSIGRYNIGYAYSPDGINWIKHSNPVLMVGDSLEWDNGMLEGPSVIKDKDTFKMWYAGADYFFDGDATDGLVNIGYAWSTDGTSWEKHKGNPVLTAGTAGSWESETVQDPHVIKIDTVYHMWYGGTNNADIYNHQTGYAYSYNGKDWFKYSKNPVLSRGDSTSWDVNTASFPSVLLDNGILKMWYTGKDVEPPTWPEPYYWDIGYATAPLSGIAEYPDNINGFEKKGYLQSSPNPFTETTEISWSFSRTSPSDSRAKQKIKSLAIYDIMGRKIRTFQLAFIQSSNHVTWNGNDNSGLSLPPGIYFCKLETENLTLYEKILFIE